MKVKRSMLLLIEAIIVAAITIAVHQLTGMEKASELLILPFDLVGKGIRTLSLSSDVGNVVAMVLYVAVSMLPVIYYIRMKIKKQKMGLSSIWLFIASGFLLFSMYYFINPQRIPSLFYRGLSNKECMYIGRFVLSMLVYVALSAYIAVRLMVKIKEWKVSRNELLKYVKWIFLLLAYGYAANITATEITYVFKLFDTYRGDIIIPLAVKELFGILPSIVTVGLFLKVVELVEQLGKNRYSSLTVDRTKELATYGRICVYASIISCIGENVLLFAVARRLTNVNFVITFPIEPVIIAFGAMLLGKYFRDSIELYEDNQSFI